MGDTSEESERNSLWIIDSASAYIAEHGKEEPFRTVLAGYAALDQAERRAKAELAERIIRAQVAQLP